MTSVTSQRLRPAEPATAVLAQWKWPIAASLTLLATLVYLFWEFLNYQVRTAFESPADYGHILVVPFIAGYFVYLQREKLLAEPFRTTWVGLIPILLGVAWYVECTFGLRVLQHHNLQSVGVMLTLGGLVLLFLGWRATWLLIFPMLYLFVFGQVISERLMEIATFRMQDITARGAHFLLSLGLDVDRTGNTIYVFSNGESKPLNIAQACSGMRMLMAFLALGVAMAYTGLKLFWQQAALVLLAVPTAIFVNILRVVTLGILSTFNSGFAAGDFHTFIGLVWLVPAFLIYLGLMWIIRNLTVEQPTRPPPGAKGAAKS